MNFGDALSGLGAGVNAGMNQGIANAGQVGAIMDRREAMELQRQQHALSMQKFGLDVEADKRAKVAHDYEYAPSIHVDDMINRTVDPNDKDHPLFPMREQISRDTYKLLGPNSNGMMSRKDEARIQAAMKPKLDEYLQRAYGVHAESLNKLQGKALKLQSLDGMKDLQEKAYDKAEQEAFKTGIYTSPLAIQERAKNIFKEMLQEEQGKLQSEAQSIMAKQKKLRMGHEAIRKAAGQEAEIAKTEAEAEKLMRPEYHAMTEAQLQYLAGQGDKAAIDIIERMHQNKIAENAARAGSKDKSGQVKSVETLYGLVTVMEDQIVGGKVVGQTRKQINAPIGTVTIYNDGSTSERKFEQPAPGAAPPSNPLAGKRESQAKSIMKDLISETVKDAKANNPKLNLTPEDVVAKIGVTYNMYPNVVKYANEALKEMSDEKPVIPDKSKTPTPVATSPIPSGVLPNSRAAQLLQQRNNISIQNKLKSDAIAKQRIIDSAKAAEEFKRKNSSIYNALQPR